MNKCTAIEVPVLIIGFNRPSIIRQCIDKLRESKPTNIYLACDGPRFERDNEYELVSKVRSIMENEIDWPCKRKYHYNEKNKGCEVTVSESITWVLKENEYVIVIEDDIIAPYSFLKFAQDMLVRYRNDERVYQVTSDNVTPIPYPNNEDYCFSIYGHIWGWATWKRAWNNFDLYVSDFDKTMEMITYRNDLTIDEKKNLRELCERLKREEHTKKERPKHTWDIIWAYIKCRDGGLTIVPRVHLSSNVGIVGLHTKGQTKSHFHSYEEDFEVKKHPKDVVRNFEYDKYHYEKCLKQAPFLVRQFKRAIGILKRFVLN